MGFGPDPFAGWEESARIHSTLRMCTDFINLVEEAGRKEEEKKKALKIIIDEWLESIGSKAVVIWEQIKTHLHTWVSVKVGSIDDNLSLYINKYLDFQINLFTDMGWVDKSEEFDTVTNNLQESRHTTEFLEEDIKLAVNKWLKTILDRLVIRLKVCQDHLYKKVKERIGYNEANYINEFFDLAIKKLLGIE